MNRYFLAMAAFIAVAMTATLVFGFNVHAPTMWTTIFACAASSAVLGR